MDLNVNLIWLPILVPFVVAGKEFLDHSDFKLGFVALFSKKSIILTIIAIIVAAILQSILQGKLL